LSPNLRNGGEKSQTEAFSNLRSGSGALRREKGEGEGSGSEESGREIFP
jgi:hypothetical protein